MLCLITGGTSGIGSAAVHALPRLGADVIFLGRNQKRGQRIERNLRKAYPARLIQFHHLELSSLVQIHRFADLLLERYEKIDCLINNAGGRFDCFRRSEEGFEMTFAVNHLSHYLLTVRLLPALNQAGQAKILTVTSSAAHSARLVQEQWMESEQSYERKQAYAKAKLANVVFAIELARRLHGTRVVSNAVDPGVVVSRFGLNNGWVAWARHVLSHAVRGELTSAVSEGNSLAELAARGEFGGVTGMLFRNGATIPPPRCAREPQIAQSLWRLSAELTGVDLDLCLLTSATNMGAS